MYSTNETIRRFSLIGAILLALTTARAVDLSTDGGYPNFNSADGREALFSLTTGADKTPTGFDALYSNAASPHRKWLPPASKTNYRNVITVFAI